MYYLSVGSIFKNESHILKEWLNHHINHGVEHFYLINDDSSDNFIQILEPFIDNGIVELFNTTEPKYDGRQQKLYNEFILPKIQKKETKWLSILDLDEFLYSPQTINIQDILKQYENFGMLDVNWIYFGSSKHDIQPNGVVENFKLCAKQGSILPTHPSPIKRIVNT